MIYVCNVLTSHSTKSTKCSEMSTNRCYSLIYVSNFSETPIISGHTGTHWIEAEIIQSLAIVKAKNWV